MADSVGTPDGAEVAICATDGTQEPAGQIGEVGVKGDGVFQGYEDSIVSSHFKNGWFRTDDLGRLTSSPVNPGRFNLSPQNHRMIERFGLD